MRFLIVKSVASCQILNSCRAIENIMSTNTVLTADGRSDYDAYVWSRIGDLIFH